MEIFQDYAYVVAGKKRELVLKLLAYPRTPTELAKMLKVHANDKDTKSFIRKEINRVSWIEGKKEDIQANEKRGTGKTGFG